MRCCNRGCAAELPRGLRRDNCERSERVSQWWGALKVKVCGGDPLDWLGAPAAVWLLASWAVSLSVNCLLKCVLDSASASCMSCDAPGRCLMVIWMSWMAASSEISLAAALRKSLWARPANTVATAAALSERNITFWPLHVFAHTCVAIRMFSISSCVMGKAHARSCLGYWMV